MDFIENEREMDIEEVASAACSSLLPEKSKGRYEAAYKCFKHWGQRKNANEVSETTMLAYFMEKTKVLKSPASLWCEYSMLKSTLFIEENINISKFPKLRAFLKRKNDGYKPKKSNVFTREEINRFLAEADDSNFLLMKVVTIMGIAGACRTQELCNMMMENVQEMENIAIVNIPDSKNGMSRRFTVTAGEGNDVCYLKIFKKYLKIRSMVRSAHQRFFMRYQDGKCLGQPVGKNTFSSIPSKIAKFLGLPNAEAYTGHSYRRTSATLLANTGVDVLALKRHGGWKSETIAEGYVADSLSNKNEVANRILYNNNSHASNIISETPSTSIETSFVNGSASNTSTETSIVDGNVYNKIEVTKKLQEHSPNFVNCNFDNCTININLK